jgi:putative serine protease PepD
MNRFTRYTWIILVILFILIWVNKDGIYRLLRPRPTAESLDFNRPSNNAETTSIILSTDEKINMDVFEEVHPAVVNIAATTLRRNFWMEIIPQEGQGSGFIIDRKGYILTNSHVVANAQKITVTMSGGEKLSASLVGRDPDSDLAIIKISSGSVDTAVNLGNSDKVRVGQKAIAIGNPFGLSHTLTTGIVSALNRSIRTGENSQIDNLIQTDAAINPGNSGGPLLNSNGEVIGINTAIFSLSGGYQGIGFAIPINRAKTIATKLITTGRVARPWLGITGMSITKELSGQLGLDIEEGVLVVELLPESPADQAGLKGGYREFIMDGRRILIGGDIITGINDLRISDMETLARVLNRMNAGDAVSIDIYRDNRNVTLNTILSERP